MKLLKIQFYEYYMPSTDQEAPVVACPTSRAVYTDPGQAYATVVYNDLLVNDNSGHIPTITCDVEYGSHFGIGNTDVVCEVVDSLGNQATCTFTVTVEGNGNSA